jgi:predicted nucleic acid-binding protein
MQWEKKFKPVPLQHARVRYDFGPVTPSFVKSPVHGPKKGIIFGLQEKENKQILERFLMKSTVSILEASKETAEIFGLVKESLRRTGHPIPVNDVWIGAHVLETGAILLTYGRHFAYIPGLRLWDEL